MTFWQKHHFLFLHALPHTAGPDTVADAFLNIIQALTTGHVEDLGELDSYIGIAFVIVQ